MLKGIYQLFIALPEIIRLINTIRKVIERRRLKADVRKINNAFRDRNAKALNSLFNDD